MEEEDLASSGLDFDTEITLDDAIASLLAEATQGKEQDTVGNDTDGDNGDAVMSDAAMAAILDGGIQGQEQDANEEILDDAAIAGALARAAQEQDQDVTANETRDADEDHAMDGVAVVPPDSMQAVAGEQVNAEERDFERISNSEIQGLEGASPANEAEANNAEVDLWKARLYPIEVILTPPSDPTQFKRLPPSWTVERILDEIKIDNEIWYSVEFDDGRVDQVAYDDLVTFERGGTVYNRFHRDQQFGLEQARMSRHRSKRHLPEDDYDDSDSSSDAFRPPHKQPQRIATLRRSTRARTSSRQQSVDELSLDIDDLKMITLNKDEEEEYDDEVEDSQRRGLGPNHRTTRSQNATQKYTEPGDIDDDLEDSSADDFIPIVTSDIQPTPKSSHKRKTRSRQNQQGYDHHHSDSSIEFETRRSARSNRNTKNMRVPEIDDDYEVYEEKPESAPKHISVREIFQPVPEESEFAEVHSQRCDTCQGVANAGKGPLIYCQGCSNSFHKVCIGQRSARDHRVTKVGADNFVLQCRICVGVYHKKDNNAPNHSMCQVCRLDGPACSEFSPRKTPKQEEKLREENGGEDPITEVDPELVNNPKNVMFRCTSCKRAWHYEHLPPLSEDSEISEDVRADRLDEYASSRWSCKDCVGMTRKLHGLVAWRPVDQASYTTGQTCLEIAEDQKEYLVKWEGRSHFHDTWMPGAWIYGVAANAMRSAFHKHEECLLPKMTTAEAVEEEWLLADVILKVRYKHVLAHPSKEKDLKRIGDIREIFVKFQGLSYAEAVKDSPPPRDSGAPWDAFCAAYKEYVDGVYFEHVSDHKMKERISQYRALGFETECELKEQPAGLRRGKLMDYQLEGVNWMLYNFHEQHNIILADEMGLGKTIQVVAFITALAQDRPNCWPFLIVVPNSTCPNWRRELKQWTPDLRVVTYHGGKAAQELAYRCELFPQGVAGGMRAHVVIMSYEAAANDAKTAFRSVKWAGLIVDEGQRLKNERSLLYLALQEMKIPFRLLLTGTPLQNNKRELFNLLQFIDPSQNAEELDLKYAELSKENIPELHELIRPYFLRRTKLQVLKFLPPMAQIILPVTMTVLQEKLSKSIMARNPELIKAIISKSKVRAGERKSLSNILMELRQCLCHPFCFSQDVEDRNITDPVQVQRNLVEASGKLLLLNVMLPKLKERGHRVLIFSQFLHSLSIIEDFLVGLGLQHSRIDGSLSALEKQKRIDAFNAPDSPLFAMLLSTRAGGVGINLATADTVIIYDPDFNPHQDIQALSRAHRIGQKHKVLCFQLMTKNTVEEKIMQIGRKKMALDHALIESMDHDDDAGDDLESILKHGAEALFTNDAQDKITYDEGSIEKLLDRSEMENTDAGNDQSAEAQFSFARVWANDQGTLTTNADAEGSDDTGTPNNKWESAWEKILKEREEEHQRELAAQQQTYGRGARRRVTQDVHYNRVGNYIEGVDDFALTDVQNQEHDDDAEADGIEGGDELYIAGDSDLDDADEYNSNSEGAKSSKQNGTKAPVAPERVPDPSPPPPPPPRKRGRPRRSGTATPTIRSPPSQPAHRQPQQQQPPHQPSQAPQTIPPHPPFNQQKPQRQDQSLQKKLQQAQMRRIQLEQQNQIDPRFLAYLRQSGQQPPTQTAVNAQAMRITTSQQLNIPLQNSRSVAAPSPLPQEAQVQRPSWGDYLSADQTVYQNTAFQITPLIPPQLTLHSNIPTPNTSQTSSQRQPSETTQNEAVNCPICGSHHSTPLGCVDLDSEISLRIAIDDLRTSRMAPLIVQTVRKRLQERLQTLTAKSN